MLNARDTDRLQGSGQGVWWTLDKEAILTAGGLGTDLKAYQEGSK